MGIIWNRWNMYMNLIFETKLYILLGFQLCLYFQNLLSEIEPHPQRIWNFVIIIENCNIQRGLFYAIYSRTRGHNVWFSFTKFTFFHWRPSLFIHILPQRIWSHCSRVFDNKCLTTLHTLSRRMADRCFRSRD